MSVKLTNIDKAFASFHAVDCLNLEIQDGEFFVLLGPSGCGKTTTLRMIAGLETPTTGSIFVHGRDVTRLEPRKRDIAMVFQDYGLYPHLKVRDNIAFPLRIRREAKPERYRKVQDVAAKLHIERLLDRKPPQLSGGEKQRVSLARALIRNPQVFLMDEPLSNLDAKLRVTMRTEIKRLARDTGITTVYVTHDQVEAMALATRIGVMNRGKMVQVGTPEEIYDHPANTFVAQFIGSPPMNLFDVRVAESGTLASSPTYFGDQFPARKLEERLSILSSRAPMKIGVRPEDIQMTLTSETSGSDVARVELVEPLGQDTYVYLFLEGAEFIAVARRIHYQDGTHVRISVDPEKLHLLKDD